MTYNPFPSFNPRGSRTRAVSSVSSTIDPANLFFDLLKESPKFHNMRGVCRFLDTDLRPSSKFWRFDDPVVDGGGAVLGIPTNTARNGRVHLSTLWVPTEMSRKGIGNRAMVAVQELAQQVIDRVEANAEGDSFRVSHLSLTLVPNSFYVPEGPGAWSLLDEGPEALDWSDPEQVEKGMIDEAKGQMAPQKRRVFWKDLQAWYERLGYVECSGLMTIERFNDDTGQPDQIQCMSRRSMLLGRPYMIWPSENADIYGEAPKNWRRDLLRS